MKKALSVLIIVVMFVGVGIISTADAGRYGNYYRYDGYRDHTRCDDFGDCFEKSFGKSLARETTRTIGRFINGAFGYPGYYYYREPRPVVIECYTYAYGEWRRDRFGNTHWHDYHRTKKVYVTCR